jgi:hypothetical protein
MKYEPHSFKPYPFLHRPVCVKCGLARMRNLLTDWCVQRGCNYQEDGGYKNALRTLPAEHRRREGIE